MRFLGRFRRRKSDARGSNCDPDESGTLLKVPDGDRVGYNPHRNEYLYWLTQDGYIIAQDVNCQHEYLQNTRCTQCSGELMVMAHLNRGGQGLSELVAVCRDCRQRANFIFDISNDVYQVWWAGQLGDLYIQQYDGSPREPHRPA